MRGEGESCTKPNSAFAKRAGAGAHGRRMARPNPPCPLPAPCTPRAHACSARPRFRATKPVHAHARMTTPPPASPALMHPPSCAPASLAPRSARTGCHLHHLFIPSDAYPPSSLYLVRINEPSIRRAAQERPRAPPRAPQSFPRRRCPPWDAAARERRGARGASTRNRRADVTRERARGEGVRRSGATKHGEGTRDRTTHGERTRR